MRKRCFLVVFCISFFVFSGNSQQSNIPDDYNVKWYSQSKNSSESMPLGGGDVGLNVWVENDELLMYVSQSGTFDENNQMLKLGRVRLSTKPNLFANASGFLQELKLKDGYMVVESENTEGRVSLKLWVDVYKPVVHIESESNIPVEIYTQYETWRTEDVVVPLGMRHSSFSLTSYPGEVITYKDSIFFDDNAVQWFHRNKDDKLLYDFIVDQQALNEVKDSIPNTQKGRTFGGLLYGSNLVSNGVDIGKYVSTNYSAWKLRSEKPSKSSHIKLALTTGQYECLEDWHTALKKTIKAEKKDNQAFKKSVNWWNEYWQRSYIVLNQDQPNASDSVWQVGRNYQLFRYMMGCNAFGDYPSKFNGSLFTFDPVFVRGKKYDWTPDFRQWGGGSFTAQNQRLVYWPMLKAGDFDLMLPQFNYYSRTLSAAEARTKVYWGHNGACFTEQLENFGLPFAGGWGFETGARTRDPKTEFGVQTNPFVKHHYVNQLEFSLMMLDYFQYSGRDIRAYLPFIKSSVKFFDEHYQYRYQQQNGQALDKNGKLVFYPSTAAESYKMATNPSDVISALMALLPRLIALPSEYISNDEKNYYQSYLNRLPDIPTEQKDGKEVIMPAESWGKVGNSEIPELYPVYPYGIYGIGKPNLSLARNTWHYGESNQRRKFTECWSQVGIFAARLGLVDESAHLVIDKLSDAEIRFPAFWGPGPDWVPDVDHGGAGMINLQEMLMQTNGDSIYLLPTWPKHWDVKFKLHAPNKTVVEVVLKEGEIQELKVNPSERRKFVIVNPIFGL